LQRPHDSLIFFLDKCLGRATVASALRAEGLHVEIQEDHFPQDTPDHVWVPEVGRRGWVILSKDSALRHNHIELVALLRSNTHSFILTSANQTGAAMGAAFVAAIPQMRRIIAKFQPPCVSAVTPSGVVNVYMPHDKLISQIAEKSAEMERLARARKAGKKDKHAP
jgi:hypothetical protein